jgi:hypothetical protein
MSPVSVIDNIALDDLATNDDTSTVGEPSVALSNQQVFVTGNWYASRSTDGGSNWTHVDPFTTLPSAAGGFCCDQVALHDHTRGVFIWILQYIRQNGANVFRLAASRDGDFGGGGWYWWDIAPTTLDAQWTGLWFDYPDAALTDDNLFVTFNVFNDAGAWQRAVVMRFPLETIANAGTLIFHWWATTDNGSLRLTQGAGNTMYWGSHNSSQQLRLFAWPDAQNAISWWNVDVGAWSQHRIDRPQWRGLARARRPAHHGRVRRRRPDHLHVDRRPGRRSPARLLPRGADRRGEQAGDGRA